MELLRKHFEIKEPEIQPGSPISIEIQPGSPNSIEIRHGSPILIEIEEDETQPQHQTIPDSAKIVVEETKETEIIPDTVDSAKIEVE